MPRQLKLYIIGVVAVGAIALLITTLVIPVDPLIGEPFEPLGDAAVPVGIAFWIVATLLASALPVRMPRGTMVAVSIAPLIAAATLGGPTAAAWVALIGTTEVRELRGRIPWYGTLTNHAVILLASVVAGWTMEVFRTLGSGGQARSPLLALGSVPSSPW